MTPKKKRSAVVAGALAILSPGLGLFYSGKPKAALLWAAVLLLVTHIGVMIIIYWDVAPLNVAAPAILVLVCFFAYLFHSIAAAGRQPSDFVLKRYNRRHWYVLWFIGMGTLHLYMPPIYGDVDSFVMPSESMEGSLEAGDYIIADMSAYDRRAPQRNDVVIFLSPSDGSTLYLKRCVAVPNDTVWLRDKTLMVNGEPFLESNTVKYTDTTAEGEQRIQPRREDGRGSRDNFGPYVVPADSYFVLGDNRDRSNDSRFFGTVRRDHMLGRVIRVYYSGDWGRIGLAVK